MLWEYENMLDVKTNGFQVYIRSRNMYHSTNFSHILGRVFVSRIV